MKSFEYFFLGIAIFQLIITIYQYFILKRKEYIYYFLYSLFISIYIGGSLLPEINPLQFTKTAENNFTIGRGLVFIAYGMYFHFGRYFTNIITEDLPFNRITKICANSFLIIGGIDIVLQCIGLSYLETDKVFRWAFIYVFISAIYAVVQFLRKRKLLYSILVIGSAILILGASIGLFQLIFFNADGKYNDSFIFYIELGIIGEFLFLTLGMVFKSKQLNEENLNLVKAQYENIIQERKRITADLHDDIGATLSSMHIFSDLAGTVWHTQPDESKKMIEKISSSSKNLMDRMGDIIWSMKPVDGENNTIQGRLKNYSSELLSPKNIVTQFNIDENYANAVVQPENKKNLLLIAKEVLNNIAKYSEATRASISFTGNKETVQLKIEDNGKGFSLNTVKTGNGLKNIQTRCLHLGGNCIINTEPGKGVHIICTFPIAICSYTNNFK